MMGSAITLHMLLCQGGLLKLLQGGLPKRQSMYLYLSPHSVSILICLSSIRQKETFRKVRVICRDYATPETSKSSHWLSVQNVGSARVSFCYSQDLEGERDHMLDSVRRAMCRIAIFMQSLKLMTVQLTTPHFHHKTKNQDTTPHNHQENMMKCKRIKQSLLNHRL